jgi:hypothetical protein
MMADMKRIAQYWELKKTFRPLFLTLCSLFRPNSFSALFSAVYRPTLNEFIKGDLSFWNGEYSLICFNCFYMH